MLADPRSDELIRNFVGQWLEARDIDSVTINAAAVLSRVKEYGARFGDYWEPAPMLERLVEEGRGFYGEAASV